MKEEKVFLDVADYIQVMGRCNRIEVLEKYFKVSLLKTIMKKYTIKEFAEGKKAVKIENEEQWNKLNKVHKLNGVFQGKFLYGNDSMYSSSKIDDPLNYYRTCNWEVLEFSQLDFEDEFVVGKWYKLPKTSNYYAKYKTMQSCSEYISNTGSHSHWDGNCNFEDAIKIDLSEIQQYLPSNHPDLMKKDTFVLPEKWAIKPKKEEGDIIREWFNTYRKYPKKHESIFYWHFPYYEFDFCEQYCYSEKQKDYTEITFDQFQQYVLKTTKTMEKEIIGYKFKEQYLKYQVYAAQIGNYNTHYDVQQYYLKEKDNILGNGIGLLKEAGVFNLWFEPVYASNKHKLPRIDGIQMVDNGDKTLTIGNYTKSFDWWEGVVFAMDEDIAFFIEFSICVNFADVQTIAKYINSQK